MSGIDRATQCATSDDWTRSPTRWASAEAMACGCRCDHDALVKSFGGSSTLSAPLERWFGPGASSRPLLALARLRGRPTVQSPSAQ